MICRRKHTANFTTIGNELFDDERLRADEVGVLSYLLSRPNDWEVRRTALARRWDVGRERIARILFSLIRFGWIVAKRERLSNGRTFVVYEVRDQPGPELSLEDAKAAVSLVSSDADDAESNEAQDDDSARVTDNPDTGDPDAAQPDTANPYVASKEESPKTESPRTDSTQAVRVFGDLRSEWPTTHVLSLVACETLFAGLTDGLKESAFQGVKSYLSDCAKANRKICDLATYLRERRWERFANAPKAAGAFHVRPRTPQAHRWREYYERVEPHKLRTFDMMMDRSGYTAPSEWPPAMPPKDESTGPPRELLTESDEEFMADGF